MKTNHIQLVAADHPSLDHDVDAFLSALACERRRSRGPARNFTERGGFRLAAIERGIVVGLARVDPSGELHLAVAAEHRGRGIGTTLGHAAVERAISLDYSRLVLRTARHSKTARRIGESLGCVVITGERGRTDLIAHLPSGLRSA